MFTGLIQHVGQVIAFDAAEAAARLVVDARSWSHRPRHGESVAVNGCCLTVTGDAAAGELAFDVVSQTLAVTTLGKLVVGSRVNLEHAVTPTTLMGGHIVQGHIDGVGTVTRAADQPGERRLRVQVPEELMEVIIEKGSIAMDGVSLTIAAVGEGWFEVALIPTTLRDTTLGKLTAGAHVNLETDYLAKTVIHWLRLRQA